MARGSTTCGSCGQTVGTTDGVVNVHQGKDTRETCSGSGDSA